MNGVHVVGFGDVDDRFSALRTTAPVPAERFYRSTWMLLAAIGDAAKTRCMHRINAICAPRAGHRHRGKRALARELRRDCVTN
jgi:hypothetical protein